MRGLSEKYDRNLNHAIIFYADRTELGMKAFHVPFDQGFWSDTVLEWAANLTSHRQRSELPPGTPEYQWECGVCSYRNRCGRGEAPFSGCGVVGLLPLTKYPREQLEKYLEAYPDAQLTPTTAHQYPDLQRYRGTYDWRCERCSKTFSLEEVDWDGDISNPPICTGCRSYRTPAVLTGPSPDTQSVISAGRDSE
jgi:hypothetical protein